MEKELKPIVSVCVQTYNHEKYIKECLEGILMQQTTFPFEIILGEDESSDGTREICKAYAEKYPDIIRLFLRSRKDVIYVNKRPTGRFNLLENLKVTKGKYVAICEGDDYWTDPLKLQKQVDFLEGNSEYSMCFHNAKFLYQGENHLNRPFRDIETREYSGQEILRVWTIPTASVVFRTQAYVPIF